MNPPRRAEGAAPDRYAVAGNPVEHSRSPFIHAEFARQTGEAVSYERLLCPLDAFAATVGAFAAGGGKGCNVTLPFKFEAFGLAARASPRARIARACNTLRFDADGWQGDNTDGAGLVRDIEANAGVRLRGARVLLVGAGGAAAGALGPLLASGAREIVVANRTPARAAELVAGHASLVQAGVQTLRATSLDGCGEGFDVVINASSSSVGGAPVPVSAGAIRPGGLAVDMMYGAAAQGFLAWAAARGATGRDGLGMLAEQAAEAFLFWRGVRPETAAVLAALREGAGAT
jgi:shikimate dehydrogenase